MAIIQVLLHNKWMSEEYCIHPLPYVSRIYPSQMTAYLGFFMPYIVQQAKQDEEHNGNVGKFLERFLFPFLAQPESALGWIGTGGG